jgi:hypothetical protein
MKPFENIKCPFFVKHERNPAYHVAHSKRTPSNQPGIFLEFFGRVIIFVKQPNEIHVD